MKSVLAWGAMAVLAAVAPASGQIMSAKAFEADVSIKTSIIPMTVSGHMYYDYDAQKQRIDTSMFGQTSVEVDRYDLSLKYVYATAFGHTMCNTCFLKPPLYPYYVPPGSKSLGNETVNGVNCEKYQLDLSGWGLTMNFWISNDPRTGEVITLRAEMNAVGVVTTMDFSNVVPGPQASSVFEPPGSCPPPRCAADVNVALVIDGSGSVSAPDFSSSKNFAGELASAFQYSSDLAAATVIQFAANVEIATGLTSNENAVISAIASMSQLKTGTNTAAGINAAVSQFNSRHASNNVMIILTDGESTVGSDPVQAAKAAKDAGIEIYCVGVGSGIDKTQLEAIASEPKNLHVFEVTDFAGLEAIVKELIGSSCPESQCQLNNDNFSKIAPASHVLGPLRAHLRGLPVARID